MANDYVSIRVSTLRGDQKIDFDTYIKIDEKLILYLRNGDSFDGSRLEKLKAKKLKKMFILNDDENRYRDYMQKNIEMALDDKSGKDISVRSEILQGAQQSNTEEVFEKPENEQAYNAAKEATGRYVDFLINNSEAVKNIMNIPNLDQNIAHHGVTVSTLAVALNDRLKIVDPKVTQLLALGGMLHDYGHFESSLKINRPLKEFTKEELELYRKHPSIGAQKVQDKKHFDTTVINIINQHEETADGKGPIGLLEKQMDPMALIVGAANAIDRSLTFEGNPKDQVVKKLMIEEVGKYPLNYIQTLGEILKEM